jgi:hypothetical protein
MKFTPSIYSLAALFAAFSMEPALADPTHTRGSLCSRINSGITPEKVAENQKKLFASWDNALKLLSSNHRTMPELAPAVTAQQSHLSLLQKAVEGVCEAQRKSAAHLHAFSEKIRASNTGMDITACQDYNNTVPTLMTNASSAYQGSADIIEKVNVEIAKDHQARSAENAAQITNYEFAKKLNVIQPRKEFAGIWGKVVDVGDAPLSGQAQSIDKHSFYGAIITGLEGEKKFLEAKAKAMETEKNKMIALNGQCRSLEISGDLTARTAQVGENGLPVTPEADPNSGLDDPNNPDPNRTPAAADPEAIDPATGKPYRCKDMPDLGETDICSKSYSEEAAARAKAEADEEFKDQNEETPEEKLKRLAEEERLRNLNNGPPPKDPNFFQRNKGLIIVGGAGVAAVGGILLYKKNQDRKEKERLREIENEAWAIAEVQRQKRDAAASATNTSTSTSTDTGGPDIYGTPPGSKLVITSGIPAGASVDSNLTEITISVVAPNGVLTGDTNTDISVSCAQPFPCAIGGTTSVRTSGGKARFSDVRFTAPHQGVKLKFTANGFAEVVSGNAFDVTE